MLTFISILPASTQTLACAPRGEIVNQLAEEFHEQPRAAGIIGGPAAGSVIELMVSEGGDTWTIIITRVDGRSCPVAAGVDWNGAIPAVVALGRDS